MFANQKEAIASTGNPLSRADRQIIADVLSWDMQRQVNPEEIVTIAITHDIVQVKLTANRAALLAVDTFRNIRRQQLEQQGQPQAKNVEEQVEVDSDDDINIVMGGTTYRVWHGSTLLGTFFQSPMDQKWLAHPKFGRDYCRYKSAEQAQRAIVVAWKHAALIRFEAQQALHLIGGAK